ncbi:unnamed protein product, partial [Staurois parvus]
PSSASVADIVHRRVPGLSFSRIKALYVDCVNAGALSLISETLRITVILADRAGDPKSVAVSSIVYWAIFSLSRFPSMTSE